MDKTELIITIVIAIYFIFTLTVWVMMERSPEGYEDDTGFHYGREPIGDDE